MKKYSEDKSNERKEEDFNDEYFDSQHIKVDPKQSQIRIDKFLMDRLQNTSRNRIQNAIRAGAITVDGKEIKPNFKIKPGHDIRVVIPRPPGEGQGVKPQDIPLDIKYEDEDLLIVYKPAGMVVHPGIGHRDGTLVNALSHHFEKQKLEIEGEQFQARLGLVHRIDKNTSGLLVVAKNEFSINHLAKQFFDHTIERTYYALVWGQPDPEDGKVEAHIGRHPRNRLQFTTYTEEEEQGKWALTHFKTLEPLYYVSLMQCNLETGRTHQIRVHMKHLGHPLFNDDRYGGNTIVKGTIFSKYKSFVERVFTLLPRHGLHAKSLGFIHPRTEEKMYFETPLPEDFEEALKAWRKYVKGRKAAIGKL